MRPGPHLVVGHALREVDGDAHVAATRPRCRRRRTASTARRCRCSAWRRPSRRSRTLKRRRRVGELEVELDAHDVAAVLDGVGLGTSPLDMPTIAYCESLYGTVVAGSRATAARPEHLDAVRALGGEVPVDEVEGAGEVERARLGDAHVAVGHDLRVDGDARDGEVLGRRGAGRQGGRSGGRDDEDDEREQQPPRREGARSVPLLLPATFMRVTLPSGGDTARTAAAALPLARRRRRALRRRSGADSHSAATGRRRAGQGRRSPRRSSSASASARHSPRRTSPHGSGVIARSESHGQGVDGPARQVLLERRVARGARQRRRDRAHVAPPAEPHRQVQQQHERGRQDAHAEAGDDRRAADAARGCPGRWPRPRRPSSRSCRRSRRSARRRAAGRRRRRAPGRCP